MANPYAVAFICCSGLFYLAFFIDFIRSRKTIRRFLRFGFLTAGGLILLEILILVLNPDAAVQYFSICFAPLGMDFIRIAGMTSLGMKYSVSSGLPNFPFLSQTMHLEEDLTSLPDTSVPVSIDAGKAGSRSESTETMPPINLAGLSIPDPTAPGRLTAATPEVDIRKALLSTVLGTFTAILYSLLLFYFFQSLLLESFLSSGGTVNDLEQYTFPLTVYVFVFAAAFVEEIIFRLGIQNALIRLLHLRQGWYWIAIVLTAALWTMGHAGVLSQDWLKFLQVFPVGLMLGWLNLKFGVESSILTHGLLNIFMVLLLPVYLHF
jgi:membrane protease YdiL (CAAX protease family)